MDCAGLPAAVRHGVFLRAERPGAADRSCVSSEKPAKQAVCGLTAELISELVLQKNRTALPASAGSVIFLRAECFFLKYISGQKVVIFQEVFYNG